MTSRVRFLHDNARPHISKITHEQIEKFGMETSPVPTIQSRPNPVRLLPFLFFEASGCWAAVQEKKADIENWGTNYFASKNNQFYEDGIQDLGRRWKEVIDACGKYFNFKMFE